MNADKNKPVVFSSVWLIIKMLNRIASLLFVTHVTVYYKLLKL
jgi:hypothetical protein